MNAIAGVGTDAVDIYNSATGAWSTAQLKAKRFYFAATSVSKFAIFAGGQDKNAGMCMNTAAKGDASPSLSRMMCPSR
jgi:hypothetical protein